MSVRIALLFVLALVCGPGAEAQAVVLEGRRCATPEPTVAQALSTARLVDAFRQRASGLRRAEPITVPVAVHVLREGLGVDQGNIPDAWIEAQVDTLNATFASFGLRFALALVERVDNAEWYDGLTLGSVAERDMKRALALDPSRVLNLYTASLGSDFLGWASLPEAGDERDDYQGVVLLDQSLPGGTEAPFNLGHTGTHEVGHWAGLYHTFSGGCSAKSTDDDVADTPKQRDATSGCPSPAPDSCPTDPGLDPIHNYMDYSDDVCMTGFTAGQSVRTEALLTQFRPTLVAGGFALAIAPRGGLTEWFIGVETTVPVWVTNTTDGPVTLTGASAEGAVVSLPGPVTIAPGGVAQLEVIVRPTRGGAVTIRLASDTGVSPDLLAVTGTAVVAPQARLDAGSLAVRVVEGGTTARVVMLANDGQGTLTFDLTSQPDWVESVMPERGTIPGGESVEITVAFDPASRPPGSLSGPLVFATNDPARDVVTLPIGLNVLVRPTLLGVGSVYPNPGRGRVTVPLELPEAADVWVDVVDVRGRVVATLLDGAEREAGYPEVEWDASQAAAGAYLVRARTSTEAAVGRVVILR